MERWDVQVQDDHQALEAQVGALEAALTIDAGDEDRRVILRRFIRAIGPDLELHLRKEEEILFPALQKLAGEETDSIEFLKKQHGQLRTTLRRLAGLVCECGCSSHQRIDWKEIAAVGKQFVDLLEEHERREDKLLIRVLEMSLKPQELMQLAQGLHRVAWDLFREGL